MYTFGYSNKFNGPVRALVAMAVGVVMLVYNGQALGLVVKIIAALLLASGVVSLAVGINKRNDSTSKLMFFNSVVDVVIAFLLFIFSTEVGNLIIYLIGLVLLGFGIFQIIALVSANRVMKVGLWAFVMPVLVTFIGGFLLFNPDFAEASMSLFAGLALILWQKENQEKRKRTRRQRNRGRQRRRPVQPDGFDDTAHG